MTEQAKAEVDEPMVPKSPGSQLRQAREAAGLTIEDVAARLRLSVDTIEALEQDRYENLPGQTFVRGYLRSYAALLDMPAGELLERYNSEAREEPAPGLKPKRVGKQVGYGDRTMRYVTVAIALVLLALVLVWWYNNELFGPRGTEPRGQQGAPASEQPVPAQPPAASIDEQPAPAAQQPSTQAPMPQQVKVAPPPPAAEHGTGALPAQEATPAPTPASAPVAAAPASKPAAAPSKAAPAAGGDRLTLRFDGTSWLEVRDATGQRLAYQLARKGDVVTVHGKAPFKVLLGNSPVVEVNFNGEPFDQSPYNTRGNTARFAVGK